MSAWMACSMLAYSQSSQQPTQQTQQQTPPAQQPTPAPQTTEPAAATTSDDSTQNGPPQEYQGPSIISRDKTLVGERGGKLLDFRVWLGVNGIYDSGLTPFETDKSGKLIDLGGSFGAEVRFGAAGSRQWKRNSLSLDYSGSYRHYTNNATLDGTDQFLSLRYGHVLSRHVTLDFKETAGTSTLANGAFSYLPITSIDSYAIPTNDLFDNRIYYSTTRGALIWQKTARLSFSISGQGYLVRRAAAALAGLNGYSGGADVAYRITKRQTVSADYTYTHYDYQRLFGYTNIQTVSLGYSIGLGRRWDASFSLGGTHAEVRGLQTTAVDPAIAAIIGVNSVVTNYDRFIVVPYAAANIIRRFSRSSWSVGANTGVSPGNGVYQTSRQTAITSSYSYVGLRRWTMGANFMFSQLSALGQTLGKYDNYQGGVAATYKLAQPWHLEFRYDYRHYTTSGQFFTKDSERVMMGIAWSPGEKPLAIW